jgi:WD40 repeat protein
MIRLVDLRKTGHPYFIFSENNLAYKNRLSLLYNLFLKNNKNENCRFKKFSITLSKFFGYIESLFLILYKFSLRKKRYENIYYIFRKYISWGSLNDQEILSKKFFHFKNKNPYINVTSVKNIRFLKFGKIDKIKDKLSSSCFLNDENNLCFAFENRTLKVFNLIQNKVKILIKCQQETLLKLSSHPDISDLFLSNGFKSSTFWKIGKNIKKNGILTIFHKNSILNCKFRKNGKFLDFITQDNAWKVYEYENQKWIVSEFFKEKIISFSSNDTDPLVAFGSKKKISIYDFRINKEVIGLNKNKSYICSLDWGYDEKLIYAVNANKEIESWDLRNSKYLYKSTNHNGRINSIISSKHPKLLITTSYDKTTKIWSRENLKNKITINHKKSFPSIIDSWSGEKYFVACQFKHYYFRI